MSAAAVDRRHAHQVELAMEIVAAELEERELDARSDAMRGRVWTFMNALGRGLQRIVSTLPGGPRIWMLFVGAVDALRGEDALERVDDARRDRELAAARELAGLLEAGESPS
jgi:hypothetical protein